MRIAIGEISQETDSFTPLPTHLRDFKDSIFFDGEELLQHERGRDVIDGARSVFERENDITLLPLLWAKTVPKGKLTTETYHYFLDTLTQKLQAIVPLDALFLSLHGATMAEGEDDVSGKLLELARSILGPTVPIIVPLDHHANITQRIVEHADLIVGFMQQPHDFFTTGEKAASLLLRIIREKIFPVTGWVKIPMITPQDQFLTSKDPMKTWFDRARAAEKENDNILAVSQFPMQPWLDAKEAGWSVVVHGRDSSAIDDIRATTRSLALSAWEQRQQFWVSERLPPEAAIENIETQPSTESPFILADTGDAVYGGSSGDSTTLLSAMLSRKCEKTYLLPMVDEKAVSEACETGVASTCRLTLGGSYDPFSKPVTVEGKITAISRGVTSITSWGITDIGRTVLFEAENIKIVLLEMRSYAINLPILYNHLGIDPKTAHAIVLKTGSNFQFFLPFCKEVIRVDTPGTTQSDLHNFTWKRIPKPTYPIHSIRQWTPEVRIKQ
jgi:microcystin degradation protein MlrC